MSKTPGCWMAELTTEGDSRSHCCCPIGRTSSNRHVEAITTPRNYSTEVSKTPGCWTAGPVTEDDPGHTADVRSAE
jgi:hypothetical protein